MTKNIRFDSISGLLEDMEGLVPISLHFNEWWNGEGLDFTFYEQDQSEKKVSLHSDEIKALAVAALAAGYIDLNEIKDGAENLLGKEIKTAPVPEFVSVSEKVYFDYEQRNYVLDFTIIDIKNSNSNSKNHSPLRIMPTYTNAEWNQLEITNPSSGKYIRLILRVNSMIKVESNKIPDSFKLKEEIQELFRVYFIENKGGNIESFSNYLSAICLKYLYN